MPLPSFLLFFTNDVFVFSQAKAGMATRFVKFVGARLLTLVLDLALAYFLVDTYPENKLSIPFTQA